MVIDQTRGDAEAERRLLTGDGGRVMDGLIISPWALPAEDITAAARPLPVVLLGERSPQGLADRVAVDNVAAAEEATAHLLSLGRRRVAAIGLQPHLRNGTAELRAEGYRAALRRAGVSPRPEWERPVAALHRADGARAMAELLDAGAEPDAVFAFSDELALGALHGARAGLRVPEDVAVVGFDDIEDGRFGSPTLTTVSPTRSRSRRVPCSASPTASTARATTCRPPTSRSRTGWWCAQAPEADRGPGAAGTLVAFSRNVGCAQGTDGEHVRPVRAVLLEGRAP